MAQEKSGDTSTGRTIIDLVVELARSRYLWVVVVCVVAAFLASWGIIHTIAEPGSQVSVWGLLQYTKKKPQTLSWPSQTPSTPAPTVERPPAKEVVVEFSGVDTRTAPGHIVAAAPYLHDFGISVAELKPGGSKVVLINNLAVYQGDAVRPTSSQNFLTQVDPTNAPASFTLVFSEPVDSLVFTRPALYPATDSGITHPAWSAHALDAAGRELSSQSEGITRSFKNIPAQRYTLRRPGFDRIAAVRFDSDPRLEGKPFAAFSTILIEQLTLLRESAGPARK